MRTLLLDIETAPNIVHCWGLWNQNISIKQIMASGYTLCFSAKWLGRSKVYFNSVAKSSALDMLAEVYGLLEEADAVVHFNGSRFDIPVLNKEFVLHGFPPPAPFTQIDLLREVRKNFRFASSKLDYVAQALGLGGKVEHKGHALWVDVMRGDKAAWKIMREYNMRDVVVLEALYHRLLPWIQDHPHTGLYDGKPHACPNCGSEHLVSRGLAYTKLSQYRRYRCGDCGRWSKGSKRILGAQVQGLV